MRKRYDRKITLSSTGAWLLGKAIYYHGRVISDCGVRRSTLELRQFSLGR